MVLPWIGTIKKNCKCFYATIYCKVIKAIASTKSHQTISCTGNTQYTTGNSNQVPQLTIHQHCQSWQQKWSNPLLFYYTRAINPDIYRDLDLILIQQSSPTEYTWTKYQQFLDYAAINRHTTFGYNPSNTVLNIYSNTVYLVLPCVKSKLAGHFVNQDPPELFHQMPPSSQNAASLVMW